MNNSVIDTGLRAVDLFAPIPLGGDYLVAGEPKSGPRVLGLELLTRLSRRAGNPPRTCVFLDTAVPDAEAFASEIEAAVSGAAELFRVDSVAAETLVHVLVQKPFSLGNAVFAFSLDSAFLDTFRKAVKKGRNRTSGTPLTAFAVTEAVPGDRFDARAICRRDFAAEGIYPALDPAASQSNAVGLDFLALGHSRIAGQAREAIAAVARELTPGRIKDENWAFHMDPSKRPALQALLYLSQPYFCAEPYTGMAGAVVPLAETVASFRAILEGRHAGVPAQRFRYLNGLEEDRLRD